MDSAGRLRGSGVRHPMVPYLADLESPFAPGPRDYDVGELVRFALGAGDYWAGLALGWLEEGAAPDGVASALLAASADMALSQQVRHRARRLARSRAQ